MSLGAVGVTRRLGCHQPEPARVASHPTLAEHPLLRFTPTIAAAGLPPEADKLPTWPRVDQGMSGSCTWGSTSIALYVACKVLGADLGFVPSQRAGYAITRAIERKLGGKTPATPLGDDGADLEDVFTAMSVWGVEPMERAYTPDGRYYDLWTNDDAPGGNVNDEPDLTELLASDKTRVFLDVGAHTINPHATDLQDQVKAALGGVLPLPILCAGFVDQQWMDATATTVLDVPDTRDPNGGGHAFWISAYRTNKTTGEIEVRVENSWGPGWALNGACWARLGLVRKLWAMYVPNVTVTRRSGGAS